MATEPLRRPVAAPDPTSDPQPTPEPCSGCKEYKKLVRDQKRTMAELQTSIDRLTRAVQRFGNDFSEQRAVHGKGNVYSQPGPHRSVR